jgi:pheromone a factor receptor
MTASNTVYTVFSGIGFVISIVPLWWHLESWNVGTCMYMIWTALACLVHFVDSILWSGNAVNWAPVWCDISIRVQLAVDVAWPACGLCIIRRLYYIASPTAVTTSQAEKRREMIVDLLITLGIPLLEVILAYIVAGHRFNIYEDYGCGPATWNTPLSYVLVYCWPLVIAVISACYGALTIRAFLKRRKQFRDLITANAHLTYSRYWRLIGLASLDFCLTVPLAIWSIVASALWGEVRPWVSWEDTHWGYSRVYQFPKVLLDQDPIVSYSLQTARWAAVLCAFVFFGFFGFADEAKKNYRLLASTVSKRLGYTTFTESVGISDSMVKSGTGSKGGVSLPVFITQQIESKRDSFDSYSDKLSTSIIINEYELKVPYSPTEQSTSSSSSSMISPDEVPRVPESILDHTSARKPSIPDAPKSVHPDNALDQV